MGKTLERIRKAKGLSQYALAKETGLSREYIRQLEEGQSDPTIGTLRRLAHALDVSLAALAAGTEQLEAIASAVVACAEGDLALAMAALVKELEHRPALILGSWKDLRASGAEPRRRTPEVVEIARGFVSQIPPLNALPPNDMRRRTITFLAQGLTDLLERANQDSREAARKRKAVMNVNEFHDRAIVALEERAGKWCCVPCWAAAADLTSPEDQQRLGALGRTFLGTTDREAKRGGICDVGAHQVKDDLLVRALPRQQVAQRY